MFCHVLHAAAEALRFRSCISFPPSRSVPLHSVRAAGLDAPMRRDPFCARILRARPCAGGRVSAGAVRAPDCARGGRRAFAPHRRPREGGGRPGPHDREERNARSGRPSPAGRGQGEGPLSPAEAAGEAPATARHAERAPTRPPPQAGRGDFMEGLCIVSWHVMFFMPPPKLCGSVPAYRSLHRVPFRSIPSAPPAWTPPCGGTLFARVSCVRARARQCASCAGAVRAPDCARETAGALLSSPPAGAFFGPSHCFPAQKSRKAAPEAASLTLHSTTLSLQSSPVAGEI